MRSPRRVGAGPDSERASREALTADGEGPGRAQGGGGGPLTFLAGGSVLR